MTMAEKLADCRQQAEDLHRSSKLNDKMLAQIIALLVPDEDEMVIRSVMSWLISQGNN